MANESIELHLIISAIVGPNRIEQKAEIIVD